MAEKRIHSRRWLSAVLAVIMLLSLTVPVGAADALGSFQVTKRESFEIAPGILETELTLNTVKGNAQNLAHLLEIDLQEPSVSVKAAAPEKTADGGWALEKPEKQAADVEAELEGEHVVGAVNANYFAMAEKFPLGAIVVDGEIISNTSPKWSYFVVHENGSAEILDGTTPIPSDAVQAIAGNQHMVRSGKAQPLLVSERDDSVWYTTDKETGAGYEYRAPRAALGLRADGTLVIFETDGRQAPSSVGMTFTEISAVMESLGCKDAILLDGGGSAAFLTRRTEDPSVTLRNNPSGGSTRAIASTLLVLSSAYVPKINVSRLNVSGVNAVYILRNKETGVRPMPILKSGEKTLNLDGTDGTVSWIGDKSFGTAKVVVQGCGDYIGTLEIPYELCPDKVQDVKISHIDETSIHLRWKAVPLAEQYVVCQYDYATKTLLDLSVTNGAETSIQLKGLIPQTSYTLCVRARAATANGVIDSYSYDWLYVKALPDQNTDDKITNIQAPVSELETLELQTAENENYLFLPAFADLTKLPLKFAVTDSTDKLQLKGSRGSVTLKSYEETVNLAAIADKNDEGVYEIDVILGDRAPMTVKVMQSSVPSLFLHSANAAQGRSYIDASKDNKTTGTMHLIGESGQVIYNGALSQIKARGNTTFTNSPKKSYQIKLESKTDLIGTAGKGKTWVLLAGYGDATQLHDKTLKDIADRLGMPYVPKNDWVDLYYDGQYRGTYLLGEKNDISSTGVDITDLEKAYEALNESYGDNAALVKGQNRFGQEVQYTEGLAEPADITGGWLLELNNTQYDEASGFKTAQGVGFNIKNPEFAGRDAVNYISEYYQEFENAVYAQDADGNYTGVNPDTGKHYYDYADLESLVQLYLIQEFSGNVDGFYSSFYFYKDAGEIMYAGPVWDLDNTFGTGWQGMISTDNRFMQKRYLAAALSKIPDFMEAVDAYYAEHFRPEAVALLGSKGIIAEHVGHISGSTAMNYKLWPLVRVSNPNNEQHLWPEGTDYPTVINDMQNWIWQKLAVMDADHHCDGPTIPEPTPIEPPADEPSEIVTPSEPDDPKPQPFDPSAVALPYRDVKNDAYYRNAVAWAHVKGVTTGVSADLFDPNGGCTRAQIVTFLWRAKGSPEPLTKTSPFKDVKADQYYTKAVLWAVEQKITNGTAADLFSPNDVCTRAQAVTFLWRMEGAPKMGSRNPFQDVPNDQYYTQAVLWAVSLEITNGMTPTTFEPSRTCSRAQIVTFIYRDLG